MRLATPPRLYREIARRGATIDIVHLGAVLSIAGGLLWVLSGALSLLLSAGMLPRAAGIGAVNEAVSISAAAGVIGGILAVHARQSSGYGLSGKMGFLAAFSSAVFLVVGLPLSSIAGVHAPRGLDLALGIAFWGLAVGLLILGIATLRLGFLPQWTGVLLVVCLPLSVAAGNYGGGILFGVLWMTLGYTILRRHDVSAIIRARGGRA